MVAGPKRMPWNLRIYDVQRDRTETGWKDLKGLRFGGGMPIEDWVGAVSPNASRQCCFKCNLRNVKAFGTFDGEACDNQIIL